MVAQQLSVPVKLAGIHTFLHCILSSPFASCKDTVRSREPNSPAPRREPASEGRQLREKQQAIKAQPDTCMRVFKSI